MSYEITIASGRLTFRQLVWVFPISYLLHVLEELPHFTDWARHYANASFSMRDYLIVHLIGFVASLIGPLLIWHFANRIVVFAFFTFVFTPAVFFNIFFHLGATAIFVVYCPGLLSAITVYAVVFFVVSRQAFREHLLSKPTAIISFVLAGIFHAADVSHNVFKIW